MILLLHVDSGRNTSLTHPQSRPGTAHPQPRLHIASSHRHCPSGAPQKGLFDLGAHPHFLPFEKRAGPQKALHGLKGNCTSIRDRQPNASRRVRPGKNASHTSWTGRREAFSSPGNRRPQWRKFADESVEPVANREHWEDPNFHKNLSHVA